MMEALRTVFTYQLVHAAIRCSIPLMYACMACIICRQANVFNMSVEGVMLFSCFIAAAVSYKTSNWVIAVLVSIIFGMLVSGFLALSSMKLKGNIVIMAIAINMFALAFTRFAMQQVFHTNGSFTSKLMQGIPTVTHGLFEGNAVLTSLFDGYNLFEVVAPFFVVALWFALYQTTWGLRLRTVGLNDMCAKTAGVMPDKYKVQALLISGAIAGLAGAHMSLGYVTLYSDNMVGGRGFIGMAAMYFGNANPLLAALACLLFGTFDALAARVQLIGIPSQFVNMLPYLITVLILAIAMASLARTERKQRSAKQYVVTDKRP